MHQSSGSCRNAYLSNCLPAARWRVSAPAKRLPDSRRLVSRHRGLAPLGVAVGRQLEKGQVRWVRQCLKTVALPVSFANRAGHAEGFARLWPLNVMAAAARRRARCSQRPDRRRHAARAGRDRRTNARYRLRGVHVGEASHPGPTQTPASCPSPHCTKSPEEPIRRDRSPRRCNLLWICQYKIATARMPQHECQYTKPKLLGIARNCQVLPRSQSDATHGGLFLHRRCESVWARKVCVNIL